MFAYPNQYLKERYRFSKNSFVYLTRLLKPHIANVTNFCTENIFVQCGRLGACGKGQYNGYLLGDRGYPCLPYLMTPYSEPEPGPQTRFNLPHSRTRAKVEMTIGILKSRFQSLRGLRVSPERACNIIVACVVLHNIATIRGESHPPCIEEDGPEEHLQILEANRDGRLLKDRICQNHINFFALVCQAVYFFISSFK
ncbi:putative nuclease HARBI1 [Silurus meridionalis]|uniref:putative nuclease HARBI1 n=1 Tax=Silurus meridionalis TaxID=175797 RepID=UPI001EEB4BCB|nr:putative nuclease HARBI1 [Silurus meridionalis]